MRRSLILLLASQVACSATWIHLLDSGDSVARPSLLVNRSVVMRLEPVSVLDCLVLRFVLIVEVTDESLVPTDHLEELLALLLLGFEEGTSHFASLFVVHLGLTL